MHALFLMYLLFAMLSTFVCFLLSTEILSETALEGKPFDSRFGTDVDPKWFQKLSADKNKQKNKEGKELTESYLILIFFTSLLNHTCNFLL